MLDMRSDTLTKPTQAMRNVMFEAEVGDNFYDEDPSVISLETKIAKLFDAEAALFVPSGTMGNQICLRLHCTPGDAVLCDSSNHIVQYETGALAGAAGIQHMQPHLKDGFLVDSERLEESFTGFVLHAPQTKVLAIENTHLKSGGRIYPFEELLALSKTCKTLGIGLHLDGARIWHAFVENSVSLAKYGKVFDTISVCFSKGLGAPVGSCVISSSENIKRAKKIRKMLGGTMRQCGFLAAAAEYAVDNHLLRLKEDHTKARQLAEFLRQKFPDTNVTKPETNIVLMRFEREQKNKVAAVLKELEQKYQMRLAMLDALTIRAVLHLDVDSAKLNEVLSS